MTPQQALAELRPLLETHTTLWITYELIEGTGGTHEGWKISTLSWSYRDKTLVATVEGVKRLLKG